MDATGKGLIEFLTFAAEKGLLPANTAGAYRAACREVLAAVEPDGWEDVNVRTVDTDDYASRFERLRMGKLKPESLLTYKSRFRNSVQMYIKYLESPSTWRYTAERPSSGRKKPGSAAVDVDDAPPVEGRVRAGSIEYPFPLRPGLVVKLHLPSDLTRPEAKRLAAFIDALSVDSTLALPAHSGNGGEVKQGSSV